VRVIASKDPTNKQGSENSSNKKAVRSNHKLTFSRTRSPTFQNNKQTNNHQHEVRRHPRPFRHFGLCLAPSTQKSATSSTSLADTSSLVGALIPVLDFDPLGFAKADEGTLLQLP
jgi:hypothetical protein